MSCGRRFDGVERTAPDYKGLSQDADLWRPRPRVHCNLRPIPQPDSVRLALARESRAANEAIGRTSEPDGRDRDRLVLGLMEQR